MSINLLIGLYLSETPVLPISFPLGLQVGDVDVTCPSCYHGNLPPVLRNPATRVHCHLFYKVTHSS